MLRTSPAQATYLSVADRQTNTRTDKQNDCGDVIHLAHPGHTITDFCFLLKENSRTAYQ